MINFNKKKGKTLLPTRILLQSYQMMRCVESWLVVHKLRSLIVSQMVTRKVMTILTKSFTDMHLIKVPRESYWMQNSCRNEKYQMRGPLRISKIIIWKPMQHQEVCNKQVVNSNVFEDRPKKVSSNNVKQKCSVQSLVRQENFKTIEALNHLTQATQVISNS